MEVKIAHGEWEILGSCPGHWKVLWLSHCCVVRCKKSITASHSASAAADCNAADWSVTLYYPPPRENPWDAAFCQNCLTTCYDYTVTVLLLLGDCWYFLIQSSCPELLSRPNCVAQRWHSGFCIAAFYQPFFCHCRPNYTRFCCSQRRSSTDPTVK